VRIAEISTVACQCGISEYTQYLTDALIKLGHEVKVFGEKNENSDAPYHVPYQVCYKRREPQTYVKLVEALNEWKPDITHIQYEWALHITDGLFLELARPRVHFMTWHNVVPDAKSQFYGKFCDRHIVHNKPCEQLLTEKVGMYSRIIPHGTRKNVIFPTDKAKEMVGIDPSRKVISVYGFIGQRKGYHLLLNSLAKMQEYCPGAYFMIIGGHHPDGAQFTANYVDLFNVAEEKYPNDVKVTGFLKDEEVDKYISASDMVVFPHLGGDDIISASGSVRRVIDSGKLVAVSDIKFYSEFTDDMVVRIPKELSPYVMGRYLGRLLNKADSDDPDIVRMRSNLKTYAEETSWSKVARQHVDYFLQFLSQ
jgi:glycosyltransferase involved in cell wall biosynthesis